jgi:hypothetical protein
MDTITDVKQENINIDEIRFSDLFSGKDIANMSNEGVDSLFDAVYKHIMKDAVYPHLSGIRVSCKF